LLVNFKKEIKAQEMPMHPRISLIFLSLFALLTMAAAQNTKLQPRITQAVDDNNLVTFKGNVHPLARAEYDRGAAPASLPMNRMLLVLQHSPEQETAVNQLLDEQQDKTSANFHHWLTPEQFGEQFGPAAQDIQTVSTWLQGHGFAVTRVSRGRHIIEFSGTAAQVQEAFHTAIHKYAVDGEEHWANASDPMMPAALTPVVAGVVSLHNFPSHPMSHVAGAFRRTKGNSELKPLSQTPEFTFPANSPLAGFFGLGPTDFATIYNLLPLWKAGIDGTGQSIAIVQESNINLQDVRDFRNLFGLPANDPQIILDGPDPGIVPGVETEALLDAEWSGGVAKGATIKVVVGSTTNTTAGIDLAALRIVDDVIAPVASESFGRCELFEGTTRNQFFRTTWQQAAVEGISVFVSAGDSGATGCENFNLPAPNLARLGLEVSGTAATPYTTAVGGTDFNDPFNPQTFWSSTNDPVTQASALSYIPEVPWNNTCTNPLFAEIGFSANPVTNCNNAKLAGNVFVTGGSGGRSSCIVSDGHNPASCLGGYPKPSWQTGLGVPNDGVRDIPDVSLFAGNGFLGQFYLICEADAAPDGTCNLNAPFQDFLGVGGTSASSPAMAAILALVNQKTNSIQGNANYVFYRLAALEKVGKCNSNSATGPASNCIFNDITSGSNSQPCAKGSPDCNAQGQPIGVSEGFTAHQGYDLTSGLGSVNANNLVNGWSGAVFTPTTTQLSLNPGTITHGLPVNVDITVSSASGTPTGQVALLTSTNQSAGNYSLGNGQFVSTTNVLPGGSYNVIANYGGDGVFGASQSSPVAITVLAERSVTATTLLNVADSGTAQYGTPIFLRADVRGASGFGAATGNVVFTDSRKVLGALALNSQGNTATPFAITTFGPGRHNIVSSYSGDASFDASNAVPVFFEIVRAATAVNLTASATSVKQGGSVTLTATVVTGGFGNPLENRVLFFNGNTQIGSAALTPGFDPLTGTTSGTAVLTRTLNAVGTDNITAMYHGDFNYLSSTSPTVAVTVTAP